MSIFARHGDEVHSDVMNMSAMAGMDMSNSTATGTSSDMSTSSMMTMMVAFQNSIATPLYSMAWTPSNVGTYAATCIFLILLAVVLRGMFALKAIQESRWLDQEFNRRYVVVNGQLPMADKLSSSSVKKNMMLSSNGVEEQVMVVQKQQMHTRPWRASVDVVRAVIDTVIAGVGYLL